MISFSLSCVFLLCVLSGISNGRRFPRQSGQPQPQSQVVLLGTTSCKANGKEHKAGEEWTNGHLRYQCNEFGYHIIGCVLKSGKTLKINEDLVSNNTAHRCYRVGNATRTYYREFTCGVAGAPSCVLSPITQETEKETLRGFQPISSSPIVLGELPPGWKIFDDQGKPVQVVSGTGTAGAPAIVSSSQVVADTGSVGSGTAVTGATGSGTSRAKRTAPKSGTATSGMTGMAGSQSSVTWSGKSKGGVGVGPGTFTIRSGPTGSATSFVPAGAAPQSG